MAGTARTATSRERWRELYIVLDGHGWLDVGGERLELRERNAVFVPAGADHRFTAYENLSVLAVLARRPEAEPGFEQSIGAQSRSR